MNRPYNLAVYFTHKRCDGENGILLIFVAPAAENKTKRFNRRGGTRIPLRGGYASLLNL